MNSNYNCFHYYKNNSDYLLNHHPFIRKIGDKHLEASVYLLFPFYLYILVFGFWLECR